jgi:hypothetical protein
MCGGGRAAGGPGWREAERGYFWLRGSAARGRVAAREGVGVTYEVSASRTPHGTGSRTVLWRLVRHRIQFHSAHDNILPLLPEMAVLTIIKLKNTVRSKPKPGSHVQKAHKM